jgi:hypothetical protein
MAVAPEPRLLPAPRSKGCAFCTRPAQSQWVGGDELDEVIVPSAVNTSPRVVNAGKSYMRDSTLRWRAEQCLRHAERPARSIA